MYTSQDGGSDPPEGGFFLEGRFSGRSFLILWRAFFF